MDDQHSQNITHQDAPPSALAMASGEASTNIPIAKLTANPDQPRAHFDELEHKWLTESIEKNGVLQPILARPLDDGRYMIIAGERRYRAAKAAGLTHVPAVLANKETRPLEELDVKRLALIENLQRSDLNDYELAFGVTEYLRQQLAFSDVDDVCRFLRRMRNKTVRADEQERAAQIEAIFRELGRHWVSFVNNQLTVFSLYPEIQKQLQLGKLDLSKARALNRIKEAEVRRHIMWNAIAQGWSTAQLLREIADLDKLENRTAESEQRRVAIATRITDLRKVYVKRRRLLSSEVLSEIESLLARLGEVVEPPEPQATPSDEELAT